MRGKIPGGVRPWSKPFGSEPGQSLERDDEVNKQLLFLGLTVIRFWGKDIRKNVDECC